MRSALVISAIGHMAVIAWASFNFASVDPFEVEPIKALPVEFIEASELTRLKAGERKAKPSEAPAAVKKAESEDSGKAKEEAKKEKVASLPPPPPPQPEPPKAAAPAAPPPRPKQNEASPDTPKPEPVPAKKEEAKMEEEKKEDKPLIAAKDVPTPAIRPRHQPSPAPKPEEKKADAKFDPDRIAALLDKAPDQSAAQSRQVASLDSGSGDPRGLDERMSISEIDALRRQIQRCWSPPVGVRGAGDLAVRLRLALNADGTLSRPPEVLTSGSGLGFLAAADSARRAVLRCQPYDLPAGKYEAWRDINVNFDPREMLGG